MKTAKMTQAAATKAARAIFGRNPKVDIHGWIVDELLASMGLKIPHHAIADGDDIRTQGNLASWLRRNAVEV